MATDDFFSARLDQMIDLCHALAVLATRMPWAQIEASRAPVFARRDRRGRLVEGPNLFGPSLVVAGAGVSNAGRPRLPIRLTVALIYLHRAYQDCDESVVGHTKAGHRLDRCWLKGREGNALHAVLCAATFNTRWLPRTIARLGLVLLCQ